MLLTDEKFSLTKFFYFFLISLNGGILFGLELVWPTRSWRYEFRSIKIVFSTFLCIYLFVSVSLSLLVGSLSLCFSIENSIALRSTQVNFFFVILIIVQSQNDEEKFLFQRKYLLLPQTLSECTQFGIYLFICDACVYFEENCVFVLINTGNNIEEHSLTCKDKRNICSMYELQYVRTRNPNSIWPKCDVRVCVWVCVYKYEEKTTNTRA